MFKLDRIFVFNDSANLVHVEIVGLSSDNRVIIGKSGSIHAEDVADETEKLVAMLTRTGKNYPETHRSKKVSSQTAQVGE